MIISIPTARNLQLALHDVPAPGGPHPLRGAILWTVGLHGPPVVIGAMTGVLLAVPAGGLSCCTTTGPERALSTTSSSAASWSGAFAAHQLLFPRRAASSADPFGARFLSGSGDPFWMAFIPLYIWA